MRHRTRSPHSPTSIALVISMFASSLGAMPLEDEREPAVAHWSNDGQTMAGVTIGAVGILLGATGAGLALDAHIKLGTPRATSDLKERALNQGTTYLAAMAAGIALTLVGTGIVWGAQHDQE